MRRFDVFRNQNPKSRKTVPYLLLLQSELLDGFPTHVVAPLVMATALGGKPARRLNPAFEIEGHPVFLLTQQIGAVATRSLVAPVTSLASQRHVITSALDLLFAGI